MSLSTVLLSKGAATVDNELDSLFKANRVKAASKPVASTSAPSESNEKSGKKEKKRKAAVEDAADGKKKKRRISDAAPSTVVEPAVAPVQPTKGKDKPKPAQDLGDTKEKAKKKRKHREEAAVTETVAAPEPSDEVVEKADEPPSDAAEEVEDAKEVDDEDDEDHTDQSDDDDALPVHESLLKKDKDEAKSKKRKRAEETQEERDARTVFVGNVALNVVKPKALRKQLIRHLTSFVPGSEVESIRFRSIAFKKPTSKLPEDDEKDGKPSTKDLHGKERAEQWRKKASDPAAGIVYQTEAEKKKVAFIKGEFHEEIDTVNAYVVFDQPSDKAKQGEDAPASAAEVAELVIERANGTTFLGKTIRTDHVGKQAAGWGTADPKVTIFVGNLDFAAKEEAIRAFFEALLKSERGEPEKTWVKSVRVVRDKATQLGKGFAYVSFVDRECVDHVLTADAEQLKFAKRTLRVQRCKAAPPTKSAVPAGRVNGRAPSDLPAKAEKGKKPQAKVVAPPVQVPKGDPKLGERLAGLDKEARKAAKAADAERIARRIAKKKAKAALQKGARGADLERGRRERKRVKNHGKGSATKPRMKSQRAIAKRNLKK